MTTVTAGSNLSLVELRRELHRTPELRFQEFATARRLSERLAASGFHITAGVGGTGVVATFDGPGAGHVALRADMDALPTQDLGDTDYASVNPGVAHACGHDVHMAVVVGAAERLVAAAAELGRLTIILQPAEEIPFGEQSGARAMIDAGVLDTPPEAILGLHCWPSLPAGAVGLDERVAMAAKDAFRVRIHGAAAHAATPSYGSDAILAVSHVILGLHHLVAREVDPGERVALNVGTVKGGVTQSVVAAEAEITGTIRTIDPEVRARFRASTERVAAAAAETVGARATVEWANEMPAVVNDAHLVDIARHVLPDVLEPGGLRLSDGPPMTTDDFALFAERVPGLYLKLGVATPGSSSWPSLHDGHFDVDEAAIDVGVTALTALARHLFTHPTDGGTRT